MEPRPTAAAAVSPETGMAADAARAAGNFARFIGYRPVLRRGDQDVGNRELNIR
jgi:hypothetical protein